MEETTKKKKRHLGLWISLASVTVFLILPIVLIFGLLFDASHKTPEDLGIDTTGTATPFRNTLVVDCFDYTADAEQNNTLQFAITEQNINQAIYDGVTKNISDKMKSTIPQIYLEIEDDEYRFNIELNAAGFFKTRIILVSELELTSDPQGLKFKITDIKLARLGGLEGITLKRLKSLASDTEIEDLFKNSLKINIESHLYDGKEHYLFYPHDNFVSDINNIVSLGDEFGFFKDLVRTMAKETKFSFDFYNNKAVTASLSLQEFHNNTSYGSYNDYVIDFGAKEVYRNKLQPLLNDGSVNKDNIGAISKFLVYGYSQLNSAEKTTVDNAAFLPTAVGKTLEEYSDSREALFATKGKPLSEVVSIEDVVTNQISESLTDAKILDIIAHSGGKVADVTFDELQLHDVLKTNQAVGFTKILSYQQKDGTIKYAFISIDNLYMNILDNRLFIVMGLNLNGYETSLVLTASIENTDGKISFKLDKENLYYGNYKCPTALFDSLSNLLTDAIPGTTGFLKYDKANNSFVIDFEETINTNTQILKLKLAGLQLDINVSAFGTKISDNGEIAISINASY